MSLYTKDYLLDGKLLYYQPKNGYRSGIEPIILSGQIYSSISKKNILDMGAGCGPVSLIISYRNPNSSVIGFEKNDYHFELANKNKNENKLSNLEYFQKDVCKLDENFLSYFDLIFTNPPFFFEDSVITSKNESIYDAKYTSKEKAELWIINMVKYLKPEGKAYLINRYENLSFMLDLLKINKCYVGITPLLSFKGSTPKNILLSVNKHEKYVEKKENEIIIHSNSSAYSKDIKNWFK
jgi:tRNA1(Val) A37 N6-methylase TrmN6